MKYWEFLIQKEGDQTWLPLETQQVEILEGRYRVVAHTDRANTPVNIQVSQLITDEMPPRKRVRKRTSSTNESGLVVVMPFVHLQPGQWKLHCSSVDAMGEMLGDGWQYDVQLQVFAQSEEDWSNEWPVPEDGQAASSLVAEGDGDAPLVNADLPLLQAQAELQQQVQEQTDEADDSSLESRSRLGLADVGDIYQVTLKQQAYLSQRDQPMTIVGKVSALMEVSEDEASQLWIRLQNPETAGVIMEAHRPLSLARLPADFKVQIQLPNEVKTRVVLGEVSLRTAAIDGERSATVLASTAFTITAGIDQILDAIANQDPGTFEEEISLLSGVNGAEADSTQEPSVPSFDLGSTGQKTVVSAGGAVLPPRLENQLEKRPEEVQLAESLEELPTQVGSSLIDLPSFEQTTFEQAAFERTTLDQVTASQAEGTANSLLDGAEADVDRSTADGSTADGLSEESSTESGLTESRLTKNSLGEEGLLERDSTENGFVEAEQTVELSVSEVERSPAVDTPAFDASMRGEETAASVFDKPAVQPEGGIVPPLVSMPPMVSAPAQFVGSSIEDSDLEADEIAAVLDDIDSDLLDEPTELDALEAPGIEGVVEAMPLTSRSIEPDRSVDSAAMAAAGNSSNLSGQQAGRQVSRRAGREVEASVAFQSLKLKDHFWDRLSTLNRQSHQEATRLAENMDAAGVSRGGGFSALSPLSSALEGSDEEVVIYDDPPVADASSNTERETATRTSDRSLNRFNETPVMGQSTANVPSQTAGQTVSRRKATSNEELPEMALPVISLPMGDLVAGQMVTVTVRSRPSTYKPFIRLWMVDRQSRSLIMEPKMLTNLRPDALGDLEGTIELQVPMDCLDVQIAAIAIDMATQQESGKAVVNRRVMPANQPSSRGRFRL